MRSIAQAVPFSAVRTESTLKTTLANVFGTRTTSSSPVHTEQVGKAVTVTDIVLASISSQIFAFLYKGMGSDRPINIDTVSQQPFATRTSLLDARADLREVQDRSLLGIFTTSATAKNSVPHAYIPSPTQWDHPKW